VTGQLSVTHITAACNFKSRWERQTQPPDRPARVNPINNHGIGCATLDVQRVEISVTQSVAVRHIHGRVEQALFSLFAQQRGSGNADAVGTNSVNRSGINKSRTLSFRPSTSGDERRSDVRQY
jgi:hypothetical protein